MSNNTRFKKVKMSNLRMGDIFSLEYTDGITPSDYYIVLDNKEKTLTVYELCKGKEHRKSMDLDLTQPFINNVNIILKDLKVYVLTISDNGLKRIEELVPTSLFMVRFMTNTNYSVVVNGTSWEEVLEVFKNKIAPFFSVSLRLEEWIENELEKTYVYTPKI